MASPSPAPGFAGVATATVGDTTLAYRERGNGEPVVLVHGSCSDLRSWDQQLPAIGASYRAIAYSQRYARPNPDIDRLEDTMLPHVDDLLAFLEAVDAAPAHLVGHSWGAFLCLLAAIRRPEAVRSLVLGEPPVLTLFVGMPPRPVELLPLLVRRPRTALAILRFGTGTLAPTQAAFRRGDGEKALRTFVSGVLGEDTYAALPPERLEQARENLDAFRAQALGNGFAPLADDDVRGVQVPTLLLTGERSKPVMIRLTEALDELLPDSRVAPIAGVSHLLHEEDPEAVNRVVLDFLAAHAAAV